MSSPSLYTPLPSSQSTRLLRLHPSADGEAVSCSLEAVDDLLSAPPYCALSYCWGAASNLTEVICNGQTIAVARNLYAALHRLEQEQSATFIWADAICINQQDVLERNQQVSIMNEIYRRASRVFIWIGPGDEHTMDVIEMIRTIADRIRTKHEISNTAKPSSSKLGHADNHQTTFPTSNAIKALDFTRAEWGALWNFYQADWFHRVWVIQEIQQASEAWLLCGSLKIDWNFVSIAAAWVHVEMERDIFGDWSKGYFPSFDGFINTGFIGQPLFTRGRTPFLAILDRARRFKSTDPRDKVFALLYHRANHEEYDRHGQFVATRLYPSWAQNELCTHLGIRPNYEKSTLEVYREVALFSIQQYQALDVLSYAWQTSHFSHSWPSWTPRWDISNSSHVPLFEPSLYKAAHNSTISLRVPQDDLKETQEPKAQRFSDQEAQKSTDFYSFYNASSGYNTTYRWKDANPDCLSVQGLNLGTLQRATSILEYSTMDGGLDGRFLDDGFVAIAKLITRERLPFGSTEFTFTRSGSSIQSQCEAIATHALHLLQKCKDDIYISLTSVRCDHCEEPMNVPIGEATSTPPPTCYHCNLCSCGDFDICAACYREGRRCEAPGHTLRKVGVPSLRLSYTQQTLDTLGAYSVEASQDAPNPLLTYDNERISFFKTSRGYQGSAFWTIEPGDVAVVLFGSEVPFILRKTGVSYRLVSACYVLDMMDGEAMDMWRNGELQEETFDIA